MMGSVTSSICFSVSHFAFPRNEECACLRKPELKQSMQTFGVQILRDDMCEVRASFLVDTLAERDFDLVLWCRESDTSGAYIKIDVSNLSLWKGHLEDQRITA